MMILIQLNQELSPGSISNCVVPNPFSPKGIRGRMPFLFYSKKGDSQMPEIGRLAPDFSLKDAFGHSVQLSDFLGKKVVLYFYPKDDTPGCTREAIGFTEQKSQFQKNNTVILGLSKDSVASHEKFCHKYNLEIPLLSDPDGKTVEAYGVWKEKNMYGKVSMGIVRTTFLIDEKGIITKIWNNVKVDGHVEAVIAAIES